MKTKSLITSITSIGLCALALGAVEVALASPPIITSIRMGGATPQFGVQSTLGTTNQIQCCTDLSQANWLVLTNLLVTENPYQFVDTATSPAPQRFYRVLVLGTNNSPLPLGMALIPAGSFTMGNSINPDEGTGDELPLLTNYVSAFYMDQYEVTKAVWDDVYNWATAHGYSFGYEAQGKATNHPAQNMTWYDAVKWCNARSEMEGRTPCYYTNASLNQTTIYRIGLFDLSADWVSWVANGYRLPTEAEWEKAARGGLIGQRFPWGNTISESQANYYGNTNSYTYDSGPDGYNDVGQIGGSPYTSPVGYSGANGYGLYDMAGNVWEWCWDWYGSYSSGSGDPRGPASGSTRVIRGGGWIGDAILCRTAARGRGDPTGSGESIGLRSVLTSGQ